MTPRAAAIAARAKQYESGIPCPQGHIGPRYTLTGQCVQCHKAIQRRGRDALAKLLKNIQP